MKPSKNLSLLHYAKQTAGKEIPALFPSHFIYCPQWAFPRDQKLPSQYGQQFISYPLGSENKHRLLCHGAWIEDLDGYEFSSVCAARRPVLWSFDNVKASLFIFYMLHVLREISFQRLVWFTGGWNCLRTKQLRCKIQWQSQERMHEQKGESFTLLLERNSNSFGALKQKERNKEKVLLSGERRMWSLFPVTFLFGGHCLGERVGSSNCSQVPNVTPGRVKGSENTFENVA